MPGDDLEEAVCKEARSVVNLQVNRIENHDQKAIWIFRSNLVLMGLVLTGVSVTFAANSVTLSQFVSWWGFLGVTSLTFSTFASALTYTSSTYDLGISAKIITDMDDYSCAGEFKDKLPEKYEKWIEHNNKVISYNAIFTTIAIILAFSSIVLFIGDILIGIYNLKDDPMSDYLLILVLLGLVITGAVLWKGEKVFIILYQD